MEIRNVAILGLGAIGCTIAPGIFQALGKEHLDIIANKERKERLEREGMKINQKVYHFSVSDVEEKKEEDLIFICVKSYQLQQAVKDIKNHVGKNTLILSLMNGVNSEKVLAETYGKEKVLYSLTTISSQMKDHEVSFSLDAGEIQFGEIDNTVCSERVKAIEDLMIRAKLPYEIPKNMLTALWRKYLFNISNNTVAAVLHARHCYFQKLDSTLAARKMVILEAKKVAEAKGIKVTDEMIDGCLQYSEDYPPDGYCSMVQDIEAGRRTEKEVFLGDLIRMADEEQIEVPICRLLYQILEAMEQAAEHGWTQHILK